MSKCLNEISIDNLYKKPKLTKFENKDLLIFSLLTFKREIGQTESHKFMFLAFAESHIELPFKFAKNKYGPFSRALQTEIEDIQDKGLIEITPKPVHDYSKKIIVLSSKGKKKLREEYEEIEKISHKLKRIFEQYSDYNATALVKYCYNEYMLRSKGKKILEWETERKSKINELNLLNRSLMNEFSNLEYNENKKILICTSLDYISKILENPMLFEIDEVISGVFIKNIEIYLNNWNKISIFSKEQNNLGIDKFIKENNEIFLFLNKLAGDYNVAESIFDEEPCIN
ncbi:MAG: hypothetical protein U9R34_07445 [Nanoarchaeota archaeon]|nr:hypothetical protein [Nanoarchaeota archaeon]